ncbi:hypothetical protein DZF91_19595 [Actinomadura logoneensis]|uniref:Uncharacterized protein n=1 Tax=Actinomadura logoneensis TaxID=2293572 RepID=A0A372JKX8_9ACTN|nr:DUF6243 family protein [Actinomadura logoneensis]RFU39978.1 hypothetical protein DZF91_19595 [Actinomadura logoneensis]
MAKNRNNMLGVGGQRRKVSRADLRGAPVGGRGAGRTPADAKRTLAESMRERLAAQQNSAQTENPALTEADRPTENGVPVENGVQVENGNPAEGDGSAER